MESTTHGVKSSAGREHPFQRGLLYLSLVVLCLAPLAFGAYPPWVSGFAAGAFCVLGVAHLILSYFLGTDPYPVPRGIAIPGYALLVWLVVMVARDVFLGGEGDRFPALSVRTLPYAFAFFSAGMLGASFGKRRRIHVLMWALTALGFILALFTIAQRYGLTLGGLIPNSVDRPAGLLINPNRFAVMESLCVSCGLGLLLASFVELDLSYNALRNRFIKQAVLLVALVVMSASLVLSLSRLTIVAFGVGLGLVAWVWVWYRRPGDDRALWELPLTERVQRVAFWSLPLIVMLAWGIVAFSVGTPSLKKRFLDVLNTEGRFDVMRASVALFEPTGVKVFGTGLGSFEAVFTAVQPAELTGRWTRLHSDWMQLALEGGLPALLLALVLTGVWCVLWWKRVRETREEVSRGRTENSPDGSAAESKAILYLMPMAGIFTVLVATGADFPLRETGMALAFFFLAGALVRSGRRRALTDSERVPRLVVVIAMSAALGWSAFVAGRNSLACASSPWFGQLFLPVEAGEDVSKWKRSVALDPGEQQVHYFLALAADNAKKASPEVLAKGLEHTRIASELSPRDYHVPWVAALLSEKLGRIDEAVANHQRAIALFPTNVPLQVDAGMFYLRRFVKGKHPGNMQRVEGVQKALEHFQFVVKREPGEATRIADWMDDSGCTTDEMMKLWTGYETAACLGRARYFGDRELWDFAAKALGSIDPTTLPSPKQAAGKQDVIWYHCLAGAVDFNQLQDESGTAHWSEVLGAGVAVRDSEAYMWVAGRMTKLSAESAERLAQSLGERLKNAPMWVQSLGHKLREGGKDFAACSLLEKTAGSVDYLCVIWADAALAIGDVNTAELQALQAWRFRKDGRDWTEWRKDFDLRLSERKARDKNKKP